MYRPPIFPRDEDFEGGSYKKSWADIEGLYRRIIIV